jgi:hypothetical protein
MIFEIKNVNSDNCKSLLNFYSKFGDRSFNWYEKKLKKEIISGTIIGKICTINENEIIGAYLGRIQSLLSNPSLKAVQSIDTLISPSYRGGKILIRLAKEFYDFLKKDSYDCVFGLPNKKIEKFRYKFLNWNLSRQTYSYTIFIPIFLLRFLYYLIKIFIKKKNFFNYSDKKIDALKKILRSSDYSCENKAYGAYWIASKNFYFTFVGLCRVGRTLNIFEKFFLLLIIAEKADGFFLKTYSTEKAETAIIFSPFSIKKKALNFSGLNFTDKKNLQFSEQSLEFVEFDTFGLL